MAAAPVASAEAHPALRCHGSAFQKQASRRRLRTPRHALLLPSCETLFQTPHVGVGIWPDERKAGIRTPCVQFLVAITRCCAFPEHCGLAANWLLESYLIHIKARSIASLPTVRFTISQAGHATTTWHHGTTTHQRSHTSNLVLLRRLTSDVSLTAAPSPLIPSVSSTLENRIPPLPTP